MINSFDDRLITYEFQVSCFSHVTVRPRKEVMRVFHFFNVVGEGIRIRVWISGV